MRQLIVGILIAPLFVNSGCFERGNAQPASPILSVEALDVLTLASPPGTRMMQGKFKIGPPSPGDRQIVSSGAGGACLIAQFKGVDKSCRQDSECNLPLVGPPAATWHGYCVGNDIQTGTPAGKCWLKPSEAYCLKGPHGRGWITCHAAGGHDRDLYGSGQALGGSRQMGGPWLPQRRPDGCYRRSTLPGGRKDV